MKIYRKTKRLKIVFILFLCSIQIFFLYKYFINQYFINNLSIKAIKEVYLPIFFRDVSNIFKKDKVLWKKIYTQWIPILLYHGVIERDDWSNILLENFRKHMFALKDAWYQTITLKQYQEFINWKINLPKKSFLLTFDDGRKDSYYPVDPILKTLWYNAVIFIITGTFSINNSQYYLSLKELKNMINSSRWEIGSHTKEGHWVIEVDSFWKKGMFFSNKKWSREENRIESDDEFKNRVINDIIWAKNDIKRELWLDDISLAYPFWEYGQSSLNYNEASEIIPDIVKKIYPISFYQTNIDSDFINNYNFDDLSVSKRITVNNNRSDKELLNILESWKTKTLPFFDNFSSYNWWKKTYWSLDYGIDKIILDAWKELTGNSIFLDGTKTWKDYIYNITLEWEKWSNVILSAMYIDDNNYLACNFSNTSISIEKHKDWQTQTIKNLKNNMEIKDISKLGISVIGNEINCYVNDKVYLNSNYENEILKGGISIKTWDEKNGNSKIIIKWVYASSIWIKTILPLNYLTINKNQWWYNTKGEMKFWEGYLLIKASKDSQWANTILWWSTLLENYVFNPKIKWNKGDNLSLLVRYIDESNYVKINILGNYLIIEEYINDKKTIISKIKNNLKWFRKDNINISVVVENKSICVLLDNYEMACGTSRRVWKLIWWVWFEISDKDKWNAELIINNLLITPIKKTLLKIFSQ